MAAKFKGRAKKMTFLTFLAAQSLLPPPALGFEVILPRFTNSGVKPVAANMRLAFD